MILMPSSYSALIVHIQIEHTLKIYAMQIDPEKPLAPSTGVRGPYVNTGSRDIGPDLPAGKQ